MNDSIAPGAREFHTTRWSLVLEAQQGGDATRAHRAMSALCRDYWYPLYAFARRRGHPPHDAQDLTQAFFSLLLEANTAADPARGRFRSYLLGAFKNFLVNDWNRRQTQKRGGGQKPVEWDALDAEARYALEPAEQADAEALFDKRWAMELLARAVGKLRADFAGRGDAETFEALKSTLSGAGAARDQIAKQLGMSEGALKVAIHRLRQSYREVLRAEIAETVDSPEEIDAEMRHLVAVLRS